VEEKRIKKCGKCVDDVEHSSWLLLENGTLEFARVAELGIISPVYFYFYFYFILFYFALVDARLSH
jgi:hypothetical protein